MQKETLEKLAERIRQDQLRQRASQAPLPELYVDREGAIGRTDDQGETTQLARLTTEPMYAPVPASSPVHGELQARTAWVLDTAKRAGVPIESVGIATAFDDLRLYRRPGRDWLLSPVHADPHAAEGLILPRAEMRKLASLDAAGVDLPEIYIAHELPPGTVDTVMPGLPAAVPATKAQARPGADVAALVATPVFHPVAIEQAAKMVPAPPVPSATARTADRLGGVAGGAVDALARALPWLFAGVAAAPAAVALGGLAALGALLELDPVVFGAVGVGGRVAVGEPAAFFALTSWVWQP